MDRRVRNDTTSTALRRWAPLAGAAVLLVAVAAGATLGSVPVTRIEQPTQPVDGLPSGSASPEATPSDIPSPSPGDPSQLQLPAWVATAVGVLCALTVAAVVTALVWVMLRNALLVRRSALVTSAGTDPTALAERARQVVAAVDAGLADLSDTDADPRRAVIACWVRLEEAAAAAGTRRLPGETPADLVGRLLTEHLVSRPVLDGFAAVYREARYATHVVDEHMRATAVAALRQLRAELAVPVEEPA
jgi:hypothetical protein